MKNVANDINIILSEWNPLEVDENVKFSEYVGYVPMIIKSIGNRTKLEITLKHIIENLLEVQFDENNKLYLEEFNCVVERILRISQKK